MAHAPDNGKGTDHQEEVTVRGAVPEADQDALHFHVQLADGRRVLAPMTEPHIDMILAAFNGYRRGMRVLLQGIARITRGGRLERIESIEHMTPLDPLDVASRLEEFKDLRDGWLEGTGRAPEQEGLAWLSAAFDASYPADLPLPHLYPTGEGKIRAEWSLGHVEASAEIDIGKRRAVWHELNLRTDEEESRTLDLAAADDWGWLVERIRSGSEGRK